MVPLDSGNHGLRFQDRWNSDLWYAPGQVSDGTMLLNPRWVDARDLSGCDVLHVAEGEPDAANVALVGGRVLMGAAHPRTTELIRARGFEVDVIDLSEFAKAEGCVTCLSILVPSTRTEG